MTNPVEPTAERTYTIQADLVVAQQGTLIQTNARLLRVMVKALIDGGATCDRSCNGTTAGSAADGVFRWTTDADVVFTDASAAHSWAVLNMGAGFGGLYLLVTCKGVHGQIDGDFQAFLATSWTGGSTTVDPTNATAIPLTNSYMLPLSNFSARVQCVIADDGSSYRIVANDDATDLVISLALLETHYTGPAAYTIKQGGCWRLDDLSADIMQMGYWYFYGTTTADVATGTMVLPAAGSPMPYQVPRLDADGALLISSGGACDSTLGWAGYVPDLWWARADAATYRATIPATGKRWACFGSVVFPWDGATDLGNGEIDAALVQVAAGGGSTPPTPVIVDSSLTPVIVDGTTIGKGRVVGFDITSAVVIDRVFITAIYGGSDIEEVVHDGANFSTNYTSGDNARLTITDGYAFTLLRRGGWRGTSVTLKVITVDSNSTKTTHSVFYPLATAAPGVTLS